ncbi:MAG: asparaginase [Actinomycetota bacterium]
MLAEQVRSGLVETVHDGAVAVVDPTGDLVAWTGDVDRAFYFRSSAKPFQAAVANLAGAGLQGEKLAIACASHDGEPVHVALASEILRGVGLGEDDLGCPPSWPLRTEAGRRLVRQGAREPRRLWHNCSGKHAAMLAACVASGWDTSTYLRANHPLQRRMADYLIHLTGDVQPVGIDGCGAPVFATSARRMAKAFARLGSDEELGEVFGAMHAYPALVSGTGNADAAIATVLDAGAKRGAAGALGVALRHRYGIGVKCWDGSDTVAGVAAVSALQSLGALTPVQAAVLDRFLQPAVHGGGRPVGSFRPVVELAWE